MTDQNNSGQPLPPNYSEVDPNQPTTTAPPSYNTVQDYNAFPQTVQNPYFPQAGQNPYYPNKDTSYPMQFSGNSPYPTTSPYPITNPNVAGQSPYPVTNIPNQSPYPINVQPYGTSYGPQVLPVTVVHQHPDASSSAYLTEAHAAVPGMYSTTPGVPRGTRVMTVLTCTRTTELRRVTCGHCQNVMMFYSHGMVRCPSCRTLTLVEGSKSLKSRAMLFIILGVLLVAALTAGLVAIIVYGAWNAGINVGWIGLYILGIAGIVIGARYFCVKKSYFAD